MKKNVNRFIELKRIDAPKISMDERTGQFKEIYTQLDDAGIKNQADRCLDCGNPYCQWKCPVHNYIPQWLKLAYEGRIIEAAELSHQTNSFPEICGRVCPQDRLCEGSCTLEDGFGAVSIGNVEKYITDEAFKLGWKPNYNPSSRIDKKVAVIGAGPSGLACADILNRQGYMVTVYDRQDSIGGLLTFGIPAFKLEKQIINNRYQMFKDAGIDFKLNTEIGVDISFENILDKYDAVFVALGTYKPVSDKSLDSSINGVYESLSFLTSVNSDLLNESPVRMKNVIQDQNVLVLGGGDTAMDCIRTSIRLGAKKVMCAYRRDNKSMPGSVREYLNSCEEGADFIFNSMPIGLIHENNKVSGVRFIKTELTIDKKLVPISGTEFSVLADVVITAFGFNPENLPWLESNNITVDAQKRIKVAQKRQQSTNPKVFAGGDLVRGASLVVNAIADGMAAAREINEFLT